jgi:ribosomal protein L21
MAKRINTEDIDESFIIASVKKDRRLVPESISQSTTPVSAPVKEQAEQAEAVAVLQETSKEETKRKRGNRHDYESLFIKESNVTARLGKTVYIRKEFHDRILKIIQVIGGNEVSLFSYIDNLIAYHFETFQEDITLCYKQKNIDNIF